MHDPELGRLSVENRSPQARYRSSYQAEDLISHASTTSSVDHRPKQLLRTYWAEASVNSIAHKHAERFRLRQYQWFTYPVVVFSCLSTMLAGVGSISVSLESNPNIIQWLDFGLLALSFGTMLLSGLASRIDPADARAKHATISNEYAEIAANVKHYLDSGRRTSVGEDQTFAHDIRIQLNIWNSLAPLVPTLFLRRAQQEVVIKTKSLLRNSQ